MDISDNYGEDFKMVKNMERIMIMIHILYIISFSILIFIMIIINNNVILITTIMITIIIIANNSNKTISTMLQNQN